MAKISAYKAHETRMWITEIVIPSIMMIACAAAIPENRELAKGFIEGAKNRVKETKIYQAVFHK